MREGRASLTATIVAAGRGIGVREGARDRTAETLLPWPSRMLVRSTRPGRPGARALRGVARVLGFGMVDHVCLRTAAIDAAVVRAVEAGCRQLVILGAGLDGRAWRLNALREVDVYEVDHPDTQAEKRRRVDGLMQAASSVSFVPVDFARDRLAERLARAGHDSAAPTIWIWEGVTPYLPAPAIVASLTDVGSRSAVGSHLAMTYVVPGLVMLEGPAAKVLERLTRAAFATIGEPVLGATDPHTMENHLQAVGYRVDSDEDARAWSRHGPGNPTLSWPFRAERLLVAIKDR